MENIRRERKIGRVFNGRSVPCIAFRYSRDEIQEKTDIKFSRVRRPEIYVHIQGDASVFVGNRMHKLNPGDVMVYNKEEIHFSTIAPDTLYERFVIIFTPEHFDFIQDLPANLFNFFYERNRYEQNLITLSDQRRQELMDLLYDTDRYVGKSEFDRDLHTFNNCIRIFQLVNEGYLHPHGTLQPQKTPKLIDDMIRYINGNYNQSLSLNSLARQMNISQSYLSAAFKKYVGISPYEYLLSVRLDHAKKLLAYGESIEDACYDSGFNNYSHFIQFFKKRTGTTPHKYQKSHAKSAQTK